VLLSGEAGVGKSGVMLQVVDALRAAGTAVLAFRIDRLEPCVLPDDVGTQLGLPGSPPGVLSAIAQQRACVLVIDQLDAVSLASGRNPQFFDCIHEMVRQAEKHPNIRLLMACRKFDLENDHRLRRLAGPQSAADEVPVGRLSKDVVERVVAGLGVDAGRLSKKQWELLALPLHLSLLAETIGSAHVDVVGFGTAKELYDLYWDRKQDLIRERKGQTVSHWTDVIDTLCEHMSAHQILSAPAAILDAYSQDARVMASEHVLVLESGRYAFFHEGFFDYAFARRFAARGQHVLELLRSGEQHLFRRAQVRQLLLHERDTDRARYLSDLRALLSSEDIRFHIKEVVFALLAQVPDPEEDEWSVLAPVLLTGSKRTRPNVLGDPLSRGVWDVIYRSTAWFELVDRLGCVERWLRDEDDAVVDLTVRLLAKVQKALPGRVAQLLDACVCTSEPWKGRLTFLMSFGEADAGRPLFDLFLRFLRDGLLDDADFWMVIYSVPERHPGWACEAIGCYLDRCLALSSARGQANPFAGDPPAIPHNEVALKVLSGSAEGDPASFIGSLLPFIIRVLDATARKDGEPPWSDPLWTSPSYGGGGRRIGEALFEATEQALRSLAAGEPETLAPVAARLSGLDYNATQFLVVRAYAANGAQYADEAADYLCERPARLETGYGLCGGGSWGLTHWATRQLLEAITPHCSECRLRDLERVVLAYYPPWERTRDGIRFRGCAQSVLLQGFVEHRRSELVRRRLHELQRKFGDHIAERPQAVEIGFVGSPISDDAAGKMTDEQWLRAIARYDREEMRERRDGRSVGGARQLAEVLEGRTKSEPERFARLACTFPEQAHPCYLNAVLRGLRDAGLALDALLQVCLRGHALPARPCGRWICQLLADLADRPLPQEALDLIVWYATESPDPERELWRTEAASGQFFCGGDILTAGIKSVRGTAAEALRDVIFGDGERITYLKPTLERLVRDPSIAVRSCVAGTLIAVLKYDPPLAIRLFQQLCDTEDVLLNTHYVERFLCYAGPNHYGELLGIIRRMITSDNAEVQTVGARQACVASLGLKEARPLADECMSGTKPLRMGAAQVFAANVAHPTFRSRCVEGLTTLFEDADGDIRSEAAHCFKTFEGEELGDYVGLIEAFVSSPAFPAHHESLTRALGSSTAKLPDVTCTVCERLLDAAGPDVSDIRTRAAYTGHQLWKLVLRVYCTATNEEARSRCLDLIDRMLQMGVYGLHDALALHDR